MADRANPIRDTDDEARALARRLIDEARFAALATLHPATGAPHVTRIGLGTDAAGVPLTLISPLALHTRALAADPRASLLVGEPGPKGDPLTHPRLTLAVTARFLDRAGPEHAALRDRWLALNPKARVYLDLPDFGFVRFEISAGALNGGFARAYELSPGDLRA